MIGQLAGVALPAFPPQLHRSPRRVLMTVDAVGGVWRYAMDLGRALSDRGAEIVFACFGPAASCDQIAEAERIGTFVPAAAPLDWMVASAAELAGVPHRIAELASRHGVDLVHLNLPSQAAGLALPVPIVVVSHSCVVTWFRGVRGSDVPADWAWQRRLNADGFRAADAVIAPSRSQAAMLVACYGRLSNLSVVYNASPPVIAPVDKEAFVLAAGRWWDDGKNGRVLDTAAAQTDWPVKMAGRQTGPNGQYLAIERAEPLGELAGRDLRLLMARAGVLASPSIYEPFGLAALEGALAGAALVLADIATYRELWDGCALFVPPHDPDAFAAALNAAARDPELRRDLAGRAKTRALRLSPAVQASRMLELYAESIEHRSDALGSVN